MVGSRHMTESLSEVRKMSGYGARGNYLLVKLETDVPNPQFENAGNLGAKLQSCHIHTMSSSIGRKNGMRNLTQKGKQTQTCELAHSKMCQAGNMGSEDEEQVKKKEDVSCRWEGKSHSGRFQPFTQSYNNLLFKRRSQIIGLTTVTSYNCRTREDQRQSRTDFSIPYSSCRGRI